MGGCNDLIESYLLKADELEVRAEKLFESRASLPSSEYKGLYRRVRVLREEAADLRYSADIMRRGVRFSVSSAQFTRSSIYANGD